MLLISLILSGSEAVPSKSLPMQILFSPPSLKKCSTWRSISEIVHFELQLRCFGTKLMPITEFRPTNRLNVLSSKFLGWLQIEYAFECDAIRGVLDASHKSKTSLAEMREECEISRMMPHRMHSFTTSLPKAVRGNDVFQPPPIELAHFQFSVSILTPSTSWQAMSAAVPSAGPADAFSLPPAPVLHLIPCP